MRRSYTQQEEIGIIGQDDLLCGAFNSYLSLATFPRTLYYDNETSQFFEIARYDTKHNDKVYQPVYRCTICDISFIKRSILSYKSFSDTSQMINLASFYQSTLYFTYIFITSLNQFLSHKFLSWTEADIFFQNLKHTAGYTEYLCWMDLFKSSSKDSFQDIRLKYFRPNQINFISITFLENRGDLMESIIRNIATYWYSRTCSYSGQLKHKIHLWDYPELQKISKYSLENNSVDEIQSILINIISYEDLSGHIFQHFLLVNKLFEPSKYLAFVKGCFSFYDGFSHDTVDAQWAHRCAWKIISGYLMPGSKHFVYIPSTLLKQVKSSSNPPYEDLFDGAIEYALFILLPCLHRYFTQYIELFEDISEESFVPSETTEDIADLIDIVQENVEVEPQPVPQIVVPASSPAQPTTPKSEDFISDILRSRNEYERFKYFLTSLSPDKNDANAEQIASPITDLECYIDIEKFKIAKGKPHARDELAANIKQTYLTKKYFFGAASPAPRNVQINVLGGSGRTMPPRPSSPIIMEVQKYVLQRLSNKWIKQYRATEDFQRRQNRGSTLGRRRGNDNTQSFVFIDSKARANAHDMLQLRKTLLDPMKSEPLKRYAKAKNERLQRDIEFWIEVQKYKDMHHRHSSTSLIRKKIDIIIDCFLDSTVFPKVQISVPMDVAHKITETRYDLGPYIFRQAQSIVTKVLCGLWTEYNSWCEKYTHQPLPFNKLELETQQKKLVKQLLRQKQRDDEKERAYIDSNKRSSTKTRISRATSVASSATSDTIRPTVEKIEEYMPTIHWKFSDTVETPYIGEHEKRKQFLLKDILDKGMFKDDDGFREYLTDKIQPRKWTTSHQIYSTDMLYNPLHQSKGRSSSVKTTASFDSSGSSKSYKSIARVHSRSNFDRTQLVSISEKLTVPSRNLNRRTAVSLHRPRPDSASSVFSAASGLSLVSLSK